MSHPRQLSLAILPIVSIMSICESWGLNQTCHAMHELIYMVLQSKLLTGPGPVKDQCCPVARRAFYFFTPDKSHCSFIHLGMFKPAECMTVEVIFLWLVLFTVIFILITEFLFQPFRHVGLCSKGSSNLGAIHHPVGSRQSEYQSYQGQCVSEVCRTYWCWH